MYALHHVVEVLRVHAHLSAWRKEIIKYLSHMKSHFFHLLELPKFSCPPGEERSEPMVYGVTFPPWPPPPLALV